MPTTFEHAIAEQIEDARRGGRAVTEGWLNPIRGIAIGIALGLIVWTAIGAVAWLLIA